MNWTKRRETRAVLEAVWPADLPRDFTLRLETDSRRVTPGCVFVALRGERFDGHDYLEVARAAGAVAAIVDHKVDSDLRQIVVPDTLYAYESLAAERRRAFAGPVVSVVGSNGKTTTTQMLASILREAYGEAFWGTRGNFNNEIGVSHTLLSACPDAKMGLVEAGMNHPGEMAVLADMVRPDTVVVTNAQREHQEFLSSVEMTAYENGFMILGAPEGGRAALPADDPCCGIWEAMCVAARKEAWLYTTKPDGRGAVRGRLEEGTLVLDTPVGRIEAKLRIAGEHNVHNATAAACGALAAGVDPEAVRRGLERFEALPGRGARHALGELTLIDDAYNANPDSVRASMRMTAAEARPTVYVLGTMGEIGSQSEACHREMGEWAKTCGLDELWTVGEAPRAAAEAFGPKARVFADREVLLATLPDLLPKRGTMTVKGSHSVGLERVVQAVLAGFDQ